MGPGIWWHILFYGPVGTSGSAIGVGSEIVVGAYRDIDFHVERISVDRFAGVFTMV